MKRQFPLLVASVTGLLMIVDNFVKMPALNQAASTVRTWVVIIALISLALGAVNLLRIHSARIAGRRAGWVYSMVLCSTMLVTIISGLTVGQKHAIYRHLYDGIMQPGSSTAMALLAFFVASAAVRSFRARNVEATLLLGTAIILMLGNAPVGSVIYSGMPRISAWFMSIPSAAAQRGLIITSAIAFIAINLRNILGFSSEWLGGSKD